MLNRDIRKTALYIFRNKPLTAVVVSAINTTLLLLLIEVAVKLANGQYTLLMILRSLAIVMFNILTTFFAVRSWILGKCRFEYLVEPLKNSVFRKKFVPLSVVITIIYFLLAIPIFVLLIILAFGLLAAITDAGFDLNKIFIFFSIYLIVAKLIITALIFTVYIFASGAQYSVAGMLRRGFVYFAKHFTGWLWFNLTVNFVPSLILAVLRLVFSSAISVLIMYIPVMAYLMIAKAGYVYENILRIEFGNEAAYNYAVKEITDNWIQ